MGRTPLFLACTGGMAAPERVPIGLVPGFAAKSRRKIFDGDENLRTGQRIAW
jgi:hypothetical protein